MEDIIDNQYHRDCFFDSSNENWDWQNLSKKSYNNITNGKELNMDKDYIYDCETNSTTVYRNKYTGIEIHISKEEITNGDMIKAIFPNGEIEEMGDTVFIERYDPYCKCQFNIKWWNAPYERN